MRSNEKIVYHKRRLSKGFCLSSVLLKKNYAFNHHLHTTTGLPPLIWSFTHPVRGNSCLLKQNQATRLPAGNTFTRTLGPNHPSSTPFNILGSKS